MPDTVKIQAHAGWLEIRIDRDERRNALNRALRLGLLRAFAQAAADGARVVVLTGTGVSFCAGLDLIERAAERAAGAPDTAADEAIELNVAIRAHPAVFIAAVNGVAFGGGMTLVNSCDLALASGEARFACPEIGFGGFATMAGPTSAMTLTRKQAAWLLLSNERIDPQTALDWGLINEICAPDRLLPRVHELAGRLADFDPATLTETKAALARMPHDVAAYRESMRNGQSVVAAIRARSAALATQAGGTDA